MKNKNIIIMAGEPYSVFFEIFFKTLKKKKNSEYDQSNNFNWFKENAFKTNAQIKLQF